METNNTETTGGVNVVALSEAIRTLPAVTQSISENRSTALLTESGRLLERCQELFRAEACAIFIIRDGVAELEAHRGYTHPLGTPIDFETLRRAFRYRVDANVESEQHKFDGITGWVASTGKEFSANSWDEIKRHPSHAGKPDKVKIWDDTRPFRCMFAVPLKLNGETIGVLKVENKRDPEQRGATFDETDKELMRTLAHCFSMAIENAHLRAQLGQEASVEISSDQPTPELSSRLTLDDRVARLDHSNMARVIERLPAHIETALEQDIPCARGGPYDQVVITGMGGSALSAEIIIDAFSERLKVPVRVVRHYTLPVAINKRTLVIVSSFSGSTEETLSIIERFPEKAANVVVITAGGRLKALASERRYPVVEIPVGREPKGFQPRSAVGYFATYFARLLTAAGAMNDATNELQAVPRFLRSIEVRPAAEECAAWLGHRIPVVYTDEMHLMSIARIAKIKFNENSKRPAFFNALPEANHNEMIGFSNKGLGEFGILYLHDPASHPRIRDRYRVMKEVLKQEQLYHVDCREWKIPGETGIQKIFAAITFADWCSYTLALLDGFDPTPVALVESFKQVLASFRANGSAEDLPREDAQRPSRPGDSSVLGHG